MALPVPPFRSRFEFGAALVAALGDLDQANLRFDSGIWDWLSLHYFDEICPEQPEKGRKIGATARYSLVLHYTRRARHLVRTSWALVRDHG